MGQWESEGQEGLKSFGESEWTWRERQMPRRLFQAWASGLSDMARKGEGAGGKQLLQFET